MYNSFDLDKLRKDNPDYISKNPFEHQKDSFEKMSSLYTFADNDHKGGILVLPTGAGKTFTSIRWICKNVLTKNIKVLWLAHTGHLLVQAYETFTANLLETHPHRKTINMRLVSSDPAHSNASQILPTDDILIITTQTAITNLQTDALDGNGEKRKTALEQFLAHCSENRLFVVLDEAHHAPAYGCRNLLIGGGKIQKGIRQLIPNSYFLGLTATPTYSDERRRGWLWEIFKDKIIYQTEKAELIKQNILAVPEYIQRNTGEEIEVDDVLFDTLVRQHKDLPEYLIEKLASDSGRNDCIINEYLSNYKTYGKTIIFADRWFQCVYIKETLMQKAKERNIKLNVDAVYTHIDAKGSSASERNRRTNAENTQILHDFKKNKIDVLINVRMLSEGTDVPDINTVFITRQTTSSILLTQMIGRALRGKRAGGGVNKDTANVVFFVDNWKKVINFAVPESKGEMVEDVPKTRGHYPIEYISIKLVEELSRKIDSGLVFSNTPFLETIPIGWYETEVLITVDEETNLFKEFVVVFENTRSMFIQFISAVQNNLHPDWEDDKMDVKFAEKQVAEWIEKYFNNEDNSNTLDLDLIKIARHIAQSKREPVFYTFDERNKHDLSQIANDLLQFNEFIVQEKLIDIYNNPSTLWQAFYKSYERFKTAFDAERNRIFHLVKYGSIPNLKLETKTDTVLNQRELTEQEKEQVFKRDNYTCLCCGKKKEKGRRVKFEVDHIVPFKFGGETSIGNSQTLCSVCNKDKGVNELNFRVYKTPLKSPKPEIELFGLSNVENYDEVIRRIVNMFYHCQAVAEIKWDDRPRFTHRYNWEIHLYEGNDPEWLKSHQNKLVEFIKNGLNYTDLKELKIY
jgi:superfamily II DNA or RNA helicase